MGSRTTKSNLRRAHVREWRLQSRESLIGQLLAVAGSWQFQSGVLFSASVCLLVLLGANRIAYLPGERITQPVYAKVDFQVPDPAVRARQMVDAAVAVPSIYEWANRETILARIKADLKELQRKAARAESFDDYKGEIEQLGWPAHAGAYQKLRGMAADEKELATWTSAVDALGLSDVYTIIDTGGEKREPRSTATVVNVVTPSAEGGTTLQPVPVADLVSIRSEKNISRLAGELAGRLSDWQVRETAKGIIFNALSAQPTLVYSRTQTEAAMKQASESVPEAFTAFTAGTPFINPHRSDRSPVLTVKDYDLLQRHEQAYAAFLASDLQGADAARRWSFLSRVGRVVISLCLAVAMIVYVASTERRVFSSRRRSLMFVALLVGTLTIARLVSMRWPQIPELIFVPILLAGGMLTIAYPRRFSMGVITLLMLLILVTANVSVSLLVPALLGTSLFCFQLEDIRTRTKVIVAGVTTAMMISLMVAAAAMVDQQTLEFMVRHALYAASLTLLTAFLLYGLLPLVEWGFETATSLSLLEWQDSRQPLLQLLAQRAPGTYNHSLMVGTLAHDACQAIGANALLAEVAALYHDIGKISKPDYFAENQQGRASLHDRLSPTMSLLIILGHVKDGMELAREYRLPRVFRPFIAEHHGTTIVRYFFHAATEQQGQKSTGRHDRDVAEAEFRYPGPKPRSKETAIMMICDAAESTARAMSEPTPGKLEALVHHVISERMQDGQFDECDITLRELHLVEEAVVKSLTHIYHGRVAYPKKSSDRGEREQDESTILSVPAQAGAQR